jgi:competence protein ComEA
MTSGERKALFFLSAIALLGVGARAARTTAHPPTRGERDALAAQLDAVDSAKSAQPPRARSGRKSATAGRAPRPARAAPAPEPRDVTTPAAPPVGPIDVDVADAAALDALPGIGPALAGRIVEERAANGPFGSLDGLQRVRGIGPALAGRLAPHVTFSGVSRLPGASGTHVRRRSARR